MSAAITPGTRKWVPIVVGIESDGVGGRILAISGGGPGVKEWTPPAGWHVANVVGVGDGFALVELVKHAEPYVETRPCEPELEAHLKDLHQQFTASGLSKTSADAEIAITPQELRDLQRPRLPARRVRGRAESERPMSDRIREAQEADVALCNAAFGLAHDFEDERAAKNKLRRAALAFAEAMRLKPGCDVTVIDEWHETYPLDEEET